MPSPLSAQEYDVIVAGAGNAGWTAALSAHEHGARVLVLEKAPQRLRGGNTRSTGFFRFTYSGLDDIRALIPDITEAEVKAMEFGEYSPDEYYADAMRVSEGRADPELTEVLVNESYPTVKWMVDQGVQWELNTGSATLVDGKLHWEPGSIARPRGGGEGLVDMLFAIGEKRGIEVAYGTKALKLLTDAKGAVRGVKVKGPDGIRDLRARAVVLACGGFQANPEMRAKYLGPGWDTIKVRGTRYDTGDGLAMAFELGAAASGHWTGCHATQVDAEAPPVEIEDKHLFRSGYHLGILVNLNGKRFVDEGEDLHLKTYAKMGRAILAQPRSLAFQIYDAKVVPVLPDTYKQATMATGNTIGELTDSLGLDREALEQTIREFNAAVVQTAPARIDPSVKDGRCTRGIAVQKSNWAQRIDTPPFMAYPVTCGITFTFGGLKTDTRARVLDTEGDPIPGLYAAGEVQGTFYHNYPGGAGLTKGAVFGRIAGADAAALKVH